jgi:hypothetical protein
MKPVPRPAARVLLAGRFLVPRASLLALPDGPVAGLDLSSGELVALAFGPGADDPAALAVRIACWNERAGPAIRELGWHLGRPLVAFELRLADSLGASCDADGGDVAARCAALGAVLDAAGLGLPCGPADLALGADGPWLRRPAIWPGDPARPLSQRLPELGSRLSARAPVPVAVDRPAARGRVAVVLARCVPGGRRARVALVVACCLLSALVSSLAGPSHGGAVARAARPHVTPQVLEALPAPAPRRVALHAQAPPPRSRGGPARVLLLAVKRVHPSPPVAATPPPAPRPVAEAPQRGWVEGLFVGS